MEIKFIKHLKPYSIYFSWVVRPFQKSQMNKTVIDGSIKSRLERMAYELTA